MANVRILVAEDDDHIRTGLIDTLQSEGYAADGAVNGNQALEQFNRQPYDLVILDIMMPEKSGYDVCRDIRSQNRTVPIIMLTAKSEEVDKVVGLHLGADDYVTKPFGVNELLARIAAVLRRCHRSEKASPSPEPDTQPFDFGLARIHPDQYRAIRQGNVSELTAMELKLIVYFHRHPQKVLDRDRLLNAVWGIDYYGTTRTLDQHVAQLRKKIESDASRPCFLQTVHGVGYRYSPDGG